MSMKSLFQKNSNMKGSGKMKKLFALTFGILLMLGCAGLASAANTVAITSDTNVTFYTQRYGAQMDTEGNVSSQDSAKFTTALYKSKLTSGKRYTNHTVVYREGEVSSNDVIAEVVTKPSDAEIFEKIKNVYRPQGGQILASNGNVVAWDKFTTEKYEMRWYVLKYEKYDSWHIDGVIVEKETQKPIEIPLPNEPDYVAPDVNWDNDLACRYAYIYGYNDSSMSPNENLIRAEVSSMVYRLVKQNDKLDGFKYSESKTPAFDDIEGEWFRSGIEYMDSKNAFPKTDSVYPYAIVKRGECFKIICLGLNITDDADLSYGDYAAILFKKGYIEGDDNSDLKLNDNITRAEICAIYNRIIGREDANLITADGEEITAETYGIKDLKEGKWYYDVILRATSSYDENGYVDIELRNHRNVLDDYT